MAGLSFDSFTFHCNSWLVNVRALLSAYPDYIKMIEYTIRSFFLHSPPKLIVVF